MAELLRGIAAFLALSSAQLVALAAVAALALLLARASVRAPRRVLALVAVLPLLSLAAEQLPEKPVPVLPAELPAALRVERPALPASRANPPPEFRRSVAAPAAAPSGLDVPLVLGVAWAAVLAVLLVRIARRVRALRGVLRSARPAGHGALLEECSRAAGLRRPPRVLTVESGAAPFLTGLLRPRIVVPRRLDQVELRFALLHELAHLRRRDHLWIGPELALRTIYFFHPLVRWALNRLQEERELRCDRFVAQVTGQRARYAEFLLNEGRRVGGRPPEAPVLALREGRTAVARRVRRILEGGRNEMKTTLRDHLTVGAVAVAILALLSLGPAAVVVAQDKPAPDLTKLDHINASKTETPGVYHVLPVYRSLAAVHVIQRGGPYGKEHTRVLAAGADYAFDAATGELRPRVPFDPEKEMIIVYGERVIPWTWRTREPLAAGSVRVLFSDHEGRRGVEFDADEASGRFWFIPPALCSKETRYYISYGFPPDPARPGTARSGSIGNLSDRARIRRFHGLPEAAPEGDPGKTIGTNASPTDDPRRWTIAQALDPQGMRVGFAKRAEPGEIRWLAHGTDYVYDRDLATIVLLRDLSFDADAEFFFVHGVPQSRNVFFAHRALERGQVSVTVDGRALAEESGFTVDHETGRITVLDPAIQRPGAKFRVSAGGWTYGN